MDALTFWGFMDSLSWRKEYSPLLYTSNFQPKYALYGALQLKDYAGY
jgi:endo-1,4-beta-xylanase